MNNNLGHLCRVCLASGSRNIFLRNPTVNSATASSTTTNNNNNYSALASSTLFHPSQQNQQQSNVSSFENLLEKLRFVSLIKIEENDNYPQMLCDLCIIQLNVAYNFKRLTIESDKKLDQFVIEKGLRTVLPSTISNPVVSTRQPEQTFPSPIQIKTETDTDSISEITICTNTDCDTFNPTNNSTDQSTSNSGSDQLQPFDNSQSSFRMVQLSNQIIQTATHTDIDFIKSYLPTESSRRTISVNTTQKGVYVANRKNEVHSKQGDQMSSNKEVSKRRHQRELLNLSSNLVLDSKPLMQKLRLRPDGKSKMGANKKFRKHFKNMVNKSKVSTKPMVEKQITII